MYIIGELSNNVSGAIDKLYEMSDKQVAIDQTHLTLILQKQYMQVVKEYV